MSEMLNINLITVTSGGFQAANGLKPKKHKATQRQSSKQIVESLKMGIRFQRSRLIGPCCGIHPVGWRYRSLCGR